MPRTTVRFILPVWQFVKITDKFGPKNLDIDGQIFSLGCVELRKCSEIKNKIVENPRHIPYFGRHLGILGRPVLPVLSSFCSQVTKG